MKKFIVLFIALALLAGCASTNDVDINKNHDAMLTAHATAAGAAVVGQSNAIKEATAFECTDQMTASECVLGKVLSGVIVAREIASIKMAEFRGGRPKTSIDAQEKVAEVIAGGIPVLGMTITAKAAIDKDKGTTTVKTDNGAINLDDSLNTETNHTTAIGDNNTVASTKGKGPGDDSESTVTNPESSVEEEAVESGEDDEDGDD